MQASLKQSIDSHDINCFFFFSEIESSSQCLGEKKKKVGLLEKLLSWKEEAGFLDLPPFAWLFHVTVDGTEV